MYNILNKSMESTNDEIPDFLKFPRTASLKKWKDYMGRDLHWKERYLIDELKSEKYMNDRLSDLYEKIDSEFFIPSLTKLEGNCMFESLLYHDVANSIDELRKGLAHIMYIFKDYKNFFPNNDLSLKEWFAFANEIEHVVTENKDTKDRKYYKYSYNIMCQDLTNLYSWTKLPTELILRTLSLLLNLDITIYHDNGHKTNINVYSEINDEEIPSLKKVHIGQLGESHYVPIDVLGPDSEIDPIFYTEAKSNFFNWAKMIEQFKINEYTKNLEELKQFNDMNDESLIESVPNISDTDINKLNINQNFVTINPNDTTGENDNLVNYDKKEE